MNILSLFDGISCGRVALERAGIKVDKYYASEIDKYAIQIAQKNYPDTIQVGDITKLRGEDFKDIDMIIGGSPCQGFSFAGKQLNFEDPRSKLFFEFVRLVKEIKPKYFLLENVKMKKEYQDVISEQLGVQPILINSALVSAQNRKRLYWTNIPNIKQPEDKGILLKDILEKEVDEKYYIKNERKNTRGTNKPQDAINLKANPLLVGGTNATIRIGEIGNGGQGQRIYSPEAKSTALSALGGGQGAKTGLYLINSNNKTHQQELLQTSEGKCRTIPAGTHGSTPHLLKTIMIDGSIRKLTPIECERLQTLPDNYTRGISDSQRYKCLGNGWTVDVIAHIFKNLIN